MTSVLMEMKKMMVGNIICGILWNRLILGNRQIRKELAMGVLGIRTKACLCSWRDRLPVRRTMPDSQNGTSEEFSKGIEGTWLRTGQTPIKHAVRSEIPRHYSHGDSDILIYFLFNHHYTCTLILIQYLLLVGLNPWPWTPKLIYAGRYIPWL